MAYAQPARTAAGDVGPHLLDGPVDFDSGFEFHGVFSLLRWIGGLEEGDLYAVGVLEARIPIAPRRDNRGMDGCGALGGHPLDCGIQVGHLQREADLPTDCLLYTSRCV